MSNGSKILAKNRSDRSATRSQPRRKAKRGRPTVSESAEISASIIEVATATFLQEGYEGTSMDGVATLANVPRSTLYNRYRDKRELLRDVIVARQKHWGKINASRDWMLPQPLQERLEYYCAFLLSWSTNPEVSAIHRLTIHAWPDDDDRTERHDVSGTTAMIEMIAEEFRTLTVPGSKLNNAPEAAARMLMAMLSGWLNLRPRGTALSDDEATETSRAIVDIFLNGIA